MLSVKIIGCLGIVNAAEKMKMVVTGKPGFGFNVY